VLITANLDYLSYDGLALPSNCALSQSSERGIATEMHWPELRRR
jgi:hypothetical protein